jgi:hypothetical protein
MSLPVAITAQPPFPCITTLPNLAAKAVKTAGGMVGLLSYAPPLRRGEDAVPASMLEFTVSFVQENIKTTKHTVINFFIGFNFN